ncbi:MAG: TetR/AcrR family transcriptional regulator [Synergistaceae bacterium]|jgi:AcrR family transcriptional regulator|nr:TetR/AcrR family transcriptional regulator [Synergistaceae bacterium]
METTDDSLTSFEVLGKRYSLPFSQAGGKTKEHILIEATVLFALSGYAAVSMRDIALKVAITPAALYNHFASKEDLWNAVLEHSVRLYYLYHDNLEEPLQRAKTFREVIDILFAEPRLMRNMFTCYCFGLIMKEQFRDPKAGGFYAEVLLGYGESFVRKHLDKCVESKMVKPFDTGTAAKIFVHFVMSSINLKVHESIHPGTKFDITESFDRLKEFILKSVEATA